MSSHVRFFATTQAIRADSETAALSIERPATPVHLRFAIAIAVSLIGTFSATSASERPASAKVKVELSARAAFDSNIYLQDVVPDPAIAFAVQPTVESLVTTVAASASLTMQAAPAVSVTASYAPELTTFHSAHGEDHRVHRAGLNLNGQASRVAWSLLNTSTWIDGGDVSPTFGGPGGITAMGGVPLRDRRAAYFHRSTFKLTHRAGAWFVRPVATLYYHDFRTLQRRSAGYENYLDRQEWTAGADVGRQLTGKTSLVAGVRVGRQDQLRLHGVDSPYDSRLVRFLVGLEGSPARWLQCAILLGPETRHFVTATPTGFDPDAVYWWIDASATITAGERDTLTLSARRFAQPAFASQSFYEDVTYEATWRRRISDRLVAGLGFRAYGGDWPGPWVRQDWIFTPTAHFQFTAGRRSSVELAFARDLAESRVPNTAGREFQRSVVSLGFKYAL